MRIEEESLTEPKSETVTPAGLANAARASRQASCQSARP